MVLATITTASLAPLVRAGVPSEAQLDDVAARFKSAYPDHVDRRDGTFLVLKDGSRHLIDDGKGAKPWPERLENADLDDMLAEPYPKGAVAAPPAHLSDPGRARNDAFLSHIYGNCRSGGVARDLVDVVWLPKKWGHRLKVTRINGVAARLAAISSELDALPARFDRFLFPAAGTFNCRIVAGTSRPSAHGYGIAIDLALKHAHYWRWTKPDLRGRYAYRNEFPREIVEVFERHGFIWGGKWYHYDTMHFEYRPELLPPTAAVAPTR